MNLKARILSVRDNINYLLGFIKWLGVAAVIGAAGGLIGTAFHLSVETATHIRVHDPRTIWLLPVGGLVIVFLYRYTGLEGKGTNSIINSVHVGSRVPLILLPVIFLSTVITHFCGGSAGREGAALQIGGSLGFKVGSVFRLGEEEKPLATSCGMSAVFSALFGTPVAAAVFALEVSSVGIIHYAGLVPCIVAALSAYGVTQFFGIAPDR